MSNAPDIHRPNQDPNDFLMGASVPSASFLKIGASVSGVVCEPPTLQQQRDMKTGTPKTWEDGNPMMQMVVTLQTEEYDAELEDDDGRRRIYIKSHMKKAVADAVKKAGAKMLEVGGRLTVTYSGDGKPTAKGFNPPKFYQAEYVAPAATYLDDQRPEEPEPAQQPHHPRANGNGHWTFDTAIAKAGEVGLDRAALIAELKKHGRSAYNAERDTSLVRNILNERHKESAFSKETEFKDDDIPF